MGAAPTIAWHSDPAVATKLWEYHDKKAKQPNDSIKRSKSAFENLMNNSLRPYLQQKGVIERLEFVGSCYANVRVNLPVEYDVIFVLKNGEFLVKKSCGAPSFTYFEVSNTNRAKLDSGYYEGTSNNVSSFLVINKFTSHIDQWIRDIKTRGLPAGITDIRRKAHGAAIQIDVYDDYDIVFNIDLVPAFELSKSQPLEDRELFVAKPYTADPARVNPKLSWRRSYSVKDKAVMAAIDQGDGVRKVILRILKAMLSNRERPRPDLAKITSYHVKTAMLHVHREFNNAGDWSRNNLVVRFFGVLAKLSNAMTDGVLNDYFASQNGVMVNVLGDISPATRQQIANVLSDIYKNNNSFLALFQ